jgi:hypothetical protein
MIPPARIVLLASSTARLKIEAARTRKDDLHRLVLCIAVVGGVGTRFFLN